MHVRNALSCLLPTAVLLIATLLLAACGADETRSAAQQSAAAASAGIGTRPSREQILSRTLSSTPTGFDPSLITDVSAQRVLDDLFEGLTAFGADGQPGPGVASSWETSEDGLVWTFHLRPEARWSNGVPLTADDFVRGWRRTVDPKTAASYAQAVAPVLNALEIATGKRPVSDLGVEALDAHTLRVQLSEPAPYLPFLMTNAWMYPLYLPAIEKHGDGWTRVENIVSNGAFRLVENVIGNRITLERNPEYWDTANVRLERVIYHVLEDRNAQSQRFLADRVQFVDTVQATDLPWLRARLGPQVVVEPYFGTFMIGINHLRGPLHGNAKLRLALSIAIDRDKLAKYVLNGAGFPAYTIMPPLENYEPQIPDWARLPTPERHALAQRLYREAGYSAEHPLRTELATASGDPASLLSYEALCAMWRTVLGAEISIHTQEFKVLLQNNRLHQNILFHSAWIGDYPDPYTFLQLYRTGFDLNYGGYSHPAYDALLDDASRQPTRESRYHTFERAERMLNEDAALIPVSHYAVRHLIKPYLKGYVPNAFDRNPSRHMYLLEHQGEPDVQSTPATRTPTR